MKTKIFIGIAMLCLFYACMETKSNFINTYPKWDPTKPIEDEATKKLIYKRSADFYEKFFSDTTSAYINVDVLQGYINEVKNRGGKNVYFKFAKMDPERYIYTRGLDVTDRKLARQLKGMPFFYVVLKTPPEPKMMKKESEELYDCASICPPPTSCTEY